MFLRSVELNRDAPGPEAGHPFDVPALAAMATHEAALRFDRGVTVLVGDNGSGKSTLLEAIAVHQGMNAEGGARGMQFQTHTPTASPRSTSTCASCAHQHIPKMHSPYAPRASSTSRPQSKTTAPTHSSCTAARPMIDPTASRSSTWSCTD